MSPTDDPRGSMPGADPLDELASAIIDGEATIEEQARATEPDVAARVAAFERTARIVGTDVPPATVTQRDAAIAAALAAWGTPEPGSGPSHDELAAARRHRHAKNLRWVGVAAAVVAVLAIGGLALSGDESDDEAATEALEESGAGDAATAAPESAEGSTADDEAAGASGFEAQDQHREAAGTDLGPFDDVDDLEVSARELAAAITMESSDGSPGGTAVMEVPPVAEGSNAPLTTVPDACRPPLEGDVFTFTATLDDRLVMVWVIEQDDGRHVVVVDPGSCETLAERAP